MDIICTYSGTVNAYIGALSGLRTAQMGITVVDMDSTEYAAAVADKAHKALTEAGENVNSASRKSGIPRSTLDRKFNAGKGIQALNMIELFEIAKLAGTSAAELARVYEVDVQAVAA